MPIEFTNPHHHDSWFRRDFDWETDKSVDLARAKLDFLARDGVSAEELLEFIQSAADHGQMTEREARQLSAALQQHYDVMDPKARAIADRLDSALQSQVPDVHDCSDEVLSGYANPILWLNGPAISDPDRVIFSGSELDQLLADPSSPVSIPPTDILVE